MLNIDDPVYNIDIYWLRADYPFIIVRIIQTNCKSV